MSWDARRCHEGVGLRHDGLIKRCWHVCRRVPTHDRPRDETHLHLDQGETETTLSLPPGHYKLTDQFADGEEHSYGHMTSHGINITVK